MSEESVQLLQQHEKEIESQIHVKNGSLNYFAKKEMIE